METEPKVMWSNAQNGKLNARPILSGVMISKFSFFQSTSMNY